MTELFPPSARERANKTGDLVVVFDRAGIEVARYEPVGFV
jgi:hypothetical protein